MQKFYEKADERILEDCRMFVNDNKNTYADYYTYRKALNLYVRLSESLLDSQNEFDKHIKEECDKIVRLEEGVEKDLAVIRFNQANYCLVLDMQAHEILEQLEIIEKNNRIKSSKL